MVVSLVVALVVALWPVRASATGTGPLYVPIALSGGPPLPADPSPGPTALPPIEPGPTPPPGERVGPRLFKSGPVQTSPDGRHVWVANKVADSVSRITVDGAVNEFALPRLRDGSRHRPLGITVSEDGGSVWVAAHDSDRVIRMDASDGRITDQVRLPHGSGPYGIALSPPDQAGSQRWLLITMHRADGVAAIDTSDLQVHELPTFRAPHGIAWTDDGTSAWVTHLIPDGEHPRLTRITVGGDRPRVTTRIRTGAATPRNSGGMRSEDPERNVAEGGYINWRGHPAQLPGDAVPRQLWFPAQYHNMHADRWQPGSVMQASLRKLALDEGDVLTEDKVVVSARHVHDPLQGEGNPEWLGYGWDAPFSGMVDLGFARIEGTMHALLVGEQSDNVLLMPVDTRPWRSRTEPDGAGLPRVGVGSRPMGVAVSPSRPEAFVYNELSFDVARIDLSAPSRPRVLERIDIAGPPPGHPLADQAVLQGARLFFTSARPELSGDGKVACASCHINGEHDGRHWAFQNLPDGTAGQGHGPRRTTDLLGIEETHHPGRTDPKTGFGFLHRSGDRDEIQDFEHTIRGPLMGGMGFLGNDAQPELGPPNAGRSAQLDAMAAFLSSVPFLERSPERAEGGGLTAEAVRGATFFAGTGDGPGDAGCVKCHVPRLAFQDFGFHDVGARRPAGEEELGDRSVCPWCAATPSLVGLWTRQPLEGTTSHVTGLDELVRDLADDPRPSHHGRAERLSVRQQRDLVAFLRSIDGQLTPSEVVDARDTTGPRIARVAPTGRNRLEVWFDESVRGSLAEPSGWRLRDAEDGTAFEIRTVDLDATSGDRLTIHTGGLPLDRRYVLEATSALADRAGDVRGMADNLRPVGDPGTIREFTLGREITITLSAASDAHLRIPVHDASPVGPNLATWSHDVPWLHGPPNALIPGFVRFEWQDTFTAATGIRDPAAIIDAQISLSPQMGDVQTLEIRRVLQPWSEPSSGGNWNRNARGAPTWRAHSHPDGQWNRPGAAALGGSGDRLADYRGEYDLAETVDARVTMDALTQRLIVEGDRVTEAFRFWLAHPDVDFGHALRIVPTPGVAPRLKLHRGESGWEDRGPELRLIVRLSQEDG